MSPESAAPAAAVRPVSRTVPPPIPTDRRVAAKGSQPNATIPLNLEDLILEAEQAELSEQAETK